MNYKLVAIDMDGTLLTPNLEISKPTIEVTRRAIDKGVMIILSTGRMHLAALPFANTLQLDVPMITCNGALIKCAKTNEEYYKKIVPQKYVEEVIQYCVKNTLSVSIYHNDEILILDDQNIYIHKHFDKATPEYVDNIDEIYEKPIIKLLIGCNNKNLLKYHTHLLYEKYKDRLMFYFSLPHFVEIVSIEANKKNALEFLVDKFDINKEEVIAIGDNFNDMEMIKYAGLGVAMGNAPDYLKEVANYVTHSNDEDGVKYILERFILNNN